MPFKQLLQVTLLGAAGTLDSLTMAALLNSNCCCTPVPTLSLRASLLECYYSLFTFLQAPLEVGPALGDNEYGPTTHCDYVVPLTDSNCCFN